MFTNPYHCYEALASRDSRFDGRFFVGVRTTGIYCRPVCRVRLPRPENCHFYPTAAAAEGAGFRPCLRCRPELAPGWSMTDIEGRLAQAGSRLLGAGTPRIAAVAERLGVSERHFRRIFASAYGVTPVEWRQTQRLLLAKQLLTDTTLPVLDVALASGFGSVRRLHATLQSRYGLTPTRLRQQRTRPRDVQPASGLICLRLGLRQPYAGRALFEMLASRAVPGLETGDAGEHARVLALPVDGAEILGVMQARCAADGSHLELRLASSLLPVVTTVLSIARQLYDVDADPMTMDAALQDLVVARPGLRVPGVADGVEGAVRLMIDAALPPAQAGPALAQLVDRFGTALTDEAQNPAGLMGLQRSFPGLAALATLSRSDLLDCGLPPALAETLEAFIALCQVRPVDLTSGASVADTLSSLAALPGMQQSLLDRIAMHVLRWPDAFPASEPRVQASLGVTGREAAIDQAARWQPWRAYAAMHLLRDDAAGNCRAASSGQSGQSRRAGRVEQAGQAERSQHTDRAAPRRPSGPIQRTGQVGQVGQTPAITPAEPLGYSGQSDPPQAAQPAHRPSTGNTAP